MSFRCLYTADFAKKKKKVLFYFYCFYCVAHQPSRYHQFCLLKSLEATAAVKERQLMLVNTQPLRKKKKSFLEWKKISRFSSSNFS